MTKFYSYFAVFGAVCVLSTPLAAGGDESSAPHCDGARIFEAGIPWRDADAAYGEYLGGECLGCHVGYGAGGVPGITGVDPDYFYEAMWEYCAGVRENEAMISVARSLDEEQLIALAAYFAQLEAE